MEKTLVKNGITICVSDSSLIERKQVGKNLWSVAAGSLDAKGYRNVIIGGKRYGVHRLVAEAFLPDWDESLLVDHKLQPKTGQPFDNSLANIRMATRTQNNQNRPSAKGVYKVGGKRCWVAKIRVDGRQLVIGSYYTEEEALKARRNAEVKYFGEFAPIRGTDNGEG